MSDRHEPDEVSDPHRFPDGRPKSSPDDTSLLGLAAVWSEIDAPMPPKRSSGRRGSHQRGRSRRARRARRGRRPPTLLVIGIGLAIMLTLGVIAFVAILL